MAGRLKSQGDPHVRCLPESKVSTSYYPTPLTLSLFNISLHPVIVFPLSACLVNTIHTSSRYHLLGPRPRNFPSSAPGQTLYGSIPCNFRPSLDYRDTTTSLRTIFLQVIHGQTLKTHRCRFRVPLRNRKSRKSAQALRHFDRVAPGLMLREALLSISQPSIHNLPACLPIGRFLDMTLRLRNFQQGGGCYQLLIYTRSARAPVPTLSPPMAHSGGTELERPASNVVTWSSTV